VTFGEEYLVHPDLFPARLAGEPWGAAELVLDLAGGPYAFVGLDAPQAEWLRARYAGFVSTGATPAPAVRCDAFRISPDELRPLDLRGRELTFDRDYQEDAVRFVGVDLLARLAFRAHGLRAAFWTSTQDPASFHGALENVFRALVAYRALDLGGALLHSAGIAPGSGAECPAVVCCGPSGAGKSTLSRLAARAGQHVASDDLNAVLPGESGARLSPVPFAGDFVPPAWDPAPRPLASICRLAKGGEESLQPMGRAGALSTLVACSPYVNTDPFRADRLLSNLDRLLHSTPAYQLTFALDGAAPDLLARAGERPALTAVQ